MPLDEKTTGGLVTLFLAVAGLALKHYRSAKPPQPLFENGEGDKYRKLITRLKASTDDHAARLATLEKDHEAFADLMVLVREDSRRIATLESRSEEGHREHGNLYDRIAELDRRFRQFRDGKA